METAIDKLTTSGKSEEEIVKDYAARYGSSQIQAQLWHCQNSKRKRRANRTSGGESRGRTDTHSEVRQILSLVRLPIPPFRHRVGLYRV